MALDDGSSACALWIVVVIISIQTCCCKAASTSTRSDCGPPELSHAELSAWLQQHHHPTSSPAADVRRRRDLPHQPSGGAACSPDTLCDPSAPQAGCHRNRDICDGIPHCASSQDELHCDFSLCPYRRASAVSMNVTGGATILWRDVNLRGCARACNDVHAGCVAFSFRPESADGRRCQVFLQVGRLQTVPGSELFVRDVPSEPRLTTTPVTSKGVNAERTSSESGRREGTSSKSGRTEGKSSESGRTKGTSSESGKTEGTSSESGRTDGTSSENGRTKGTSSESDRTEGTSSESGRTDGTSYESGKTEGTSSESGRREGTSSENGVTAATQFVRSFLHDGVAAVARRSKRATNCEGHDMFECTSLGPTNDCVPYSQVCDGSNQCQGVGDEMLCDFIFAKFTRQQGRSIASSVQLRGVNKYACARYCEEHFYTFPSCDSFSYHEKQQVCKFGCSWCGDTADVVPDANADYYKSKSTPYGFNYGTTNQNRQASSSSSGPDTLPPSLSSSGGASTAPPITFQRKSTTPSPPTACPSTAAPPPPEPSPPELRQTDCGRRPLSSLPELVTRTRVLTDSSRRVVNGQPVTYGTYPWQAQIQVYSDSGHFQHHCGGALIGERLVLTAAHCLRPALARLQVKLGQHDRRDAGEQYEQTFSVENALTHPGYRSDPARGDADDLAVLKLRLRQGRPVVFSSHVQPLCLPTGSPLPAGQECHISGWGKTDSQLPDSPDSAADVLHGAVVPLVSDTVCSAREVYGERFVPGRMVCAGHLSGGPDACQGDSGGPLACQAEDGRWQLTGIVSFGEGCGDLLKPGVYTRVRYYVPWIRRVVQLL